MCPIRRILYINMLYLYIYFLFQTSHFTSRKISPDVTAIPTAITRHSLTFSHAAHRRIKICVADTRLRSLPARLRIISIRGGKGSHSSYYILTFTSFRLRFFFLKKKAFQMIRIGFKIYW